MQIIQITLPSMKLVGTTVRTNNKNEQNPETKRILPHMLKYFSEHIKEQTLHRTNPGTMISAYTNYESNHTGDYTHFFGEEVNSFEGQPSHLEQLEIPPQTYMKYTNDAGKMPQVIFDTWQTIWDDAKLESNRRYVTDFEVYDHRSTDMENAIFDVFIGIK